MKTRLFNSLAILGSLICLASSCVKESSEGDAFPLAGTKISFSASTSYQNDGTRAYYNETRTVYSGTVSGGKEKIHWVSGDKIKIQYNNGANASSLSSVGQGVYNITNIDQNAKEEAQIQHAGGSGNGTNLEWGSGASHAFYAVYPSTATLSSAGTVTGTIPSSQSFTYNSTQSKYLPSDMTCAYMVSYAGADQISSSNNVTLYFSPAVTAFEFKLKLPANKSSLKIKQIQLSSAVENISGSFSLDIDGIDSNHIVGIDNVTVTSGGGKTVTANIPYGSGDANLNNSTYLDFTVFTLPVDITQLTLKIKYTNDSVQAIPLKKGSNWVKFDAGKKHIISNDNVPDEQDWVYSIANVSGETVNGGATATTFTTINVNSTKTNQVSGSSSAVGWKVQYKDDGNNWYDTNDSSHPLSSYASYASVSTTSTTLTVSYAAESSNSATVDNTISPFEAAKRILQSRPARSGYDLSKHKIDGTDISMTTANCYVVTAPGTYKFPCVYGNAIKGGYDNPSAYSPSTATNSLSGAKRPDLTTNMSQLKDVNTYWATNEPVFYLPKFVNAWNEQIRYPNIYTDLNESSGSARLVWSQNSTPITVNSSLTDEGGYKYITFTITQANIQPDNLVIAMIDEDESTIVWSWHIWVTDKNLAPASGRTDMPYSLGWIDSDTTPQTGAVSKYPNREVTFRLVQTEGNNLATDSFVLKRIGDIASIDETKTHGNNPHYQWGRKDPFVITSSATYYAANELAGAPIRMPNGLFVSQTDAPWSTSWMGGDVRVLAPCYDGVYWYRPNGNGPYTYAQVQNFVNLGLSASDFYWEYVYWYSPNGSGPYTYAQVQDFVNNQGLNASDFYRKNSNISGRTNSSIPANLWNSYIYKEGALNSAGNKFKTVYDPCPVGFTVPTADYYLGSAVSSTNFTETGTGQNITKTKSTSVSGLGDYQLSGAREINPSTGTMPVSNTGSYGIYWTDHPLSMKRLNNSYPDLLSSYSYNYQHAYMLQVTSSSSNVVSFLRGNAASIRPMVDPKF